MHRLEQGDWPEDSHLENGNYWCKCVTCENNFIGHKCRVVCRWCATPKESMLYRLNLWLEVARPLQFVVVMAGLISVATTLVILTFRLVF